MLLEDNGKVGERRKVSGRKVVPNYRLRTPKRSFAYAQTQKQKKNPPLKAERGITLYINRERLQLVLNHDE